MGIRCGVEEPPPPACFLGGLPKNLLETLDAFDGVSSLSKGLRCLKRGGVLKTEVAATV